MSKELDETLLNVARETFEQLAFMLSMPDEEDAVAPSRMAASVEFIGPLSGTLIVSVSEKMLPALLGNMLGLEMGDEPELGKQHDALKELANVICGNLLPAIAGTEAVFTVHAPVLLSSKAVSETYDRQEAAATTHLTLDEGETELGLFLNDVPTTEAEAE